MCPPDQTTFDYVDTRSSEPYEPVFADGASGVAFVCICSALCQTHTQQPCDVRQNVCAKQKMLQHIAVTDRDSGSSSVGLAED